jgi:hypothetical protein
MFPLMGAYYGAAARRRGLGSYLGGGPGQILEGEITTVMNNSYSLLLSPKAIASMAAKMARSPLAANLSERCQGISFLSQPLKLTGAHATLSTQVGPWILLYHLARVSGWEQSNSPDIRGGVWRISGEDTHRLAEALRRAFSVAPVVSAKVKDGLDGLLAVCDGGEIQIELT